MLKLNTLALLFTLFLLKLVLGLLLCELILPLLLLYGSLCLSFGLLCRKLCFFCFTLYAALFVFLYTIDYLPEFLNNNWYIGYSFEQAKYIMFTPNCQYIKNTIHPQNVVYTIPI